MECFYCKHKAIPKPKGEIKNGEWFYHHSACAHCGKWFLFRWAKKIKIKLTERV
jgi:DNA-directed RNA polymerase subunit RPC12/RpoP